MGKRSLRKAAQALGRKGGKAGTGASKVRGNSAYYRNIRLGRKRSDFPKSFARAGDIPAIWLEGFVRQEMERAGCSREEAVRRAVEEWQKEEKP